jgi:hypothetical protein
LEFLSRRMREQLVDLFDYYKKCDIKSLVVVLVS